MQWLWLVVEMESRSVISSTHAWPCRPRRAHRFLERGPSSSARWSHTQIKFRVFERFMGQFWAILRYLRGKFEIFVRHDDNSNRQRFPCCSGSRTPAEFHALKNIQLAHAPCRRASLWHIANRWPKHWKYVSIFFSSFAHNAYDAIDVVAATLLLLYCDLWCDLWCDYHGHLCVVFVGFPSSSLLWFTFTP